MNIYNKAFWKDAGERALTTAAQAFIAVWFAGGVLNVASLDFGEIGLAALSAAVLSLAKSLGAAQIGVKGTASLTTAVVQNPAERR